MAKATNKQRKAVEAAILAGLLMTYAGKRNEVRTGLKLQALDALPKDAQNKLKAFAKERAQKWQNGTNLHIQAALNDLPADATPADKAAAIKEERSNQAAYIGATLAPYLASWASTQATIDTYDELPSPDAPDQPLTNAVQWQWEQATDFPDDCMDAATASPASLDELLSITGQPPPVHINCLCNLSPLGPSPDEYASAMRLLGASGALSPEDQAVQTLQGMKVQVNTEADMTRRQVPIPVK